VTGAVRSFLPVRQIRVSWAPRRAVATGLVLIVAIAVAGLESLASAQDSGVTPRRGRVAAPAQDTALRQADGQGSAAGREQALGNGSRQQLEQRLRLQFEQIVRQRLQLTDAQVTRLRETNRQFAPQRRALAVREREIRQEMRASLRGRGAGAVDERRMSTLIDSLLTLQHARLDMLQSEQRDLATYLSPSQRVRYYGLQEQMRRRIEALRQRRQAQ
jgi:hypothetical protein